MQSNLVKSNDLQYEIFIHSFQEGINLAVKRDFTMRERIHFNIFKVSSKQMVRQMSLRYNPDEGEIPKQIVMEPKLTNQVKYIVGIIFSICLHSNTNQ